MTLDEMQQLCDIEPHLRTEEDDQRFYIAAREMVPKLIKVAKAAARRADATKTVEWIDKYPDTEREGIWKEDGRSITALENALADLEQP